MTGALAKLETQLDVWLNKKAPVSLPPNARKGLADVMWIIVLIFGVLQLWAAYGLWQIAQRTEQSIDFSNSLSYGYTDYAATTAGLGFLFYLSLGVLIVDAVLLLVAAAGLKARQKTGWNLLFYSLLLNVLYGVVRAFSDLGGLGVLIIVLIESVIAGWLIFQIREHFVSNKMPAHKVGSTTEKKH
ncbi:MAG TPA: hypothetical protein VJ836_04315 [Candidatus Saccharimonadales bacterium]|nr:hypothetical protein [Candidatus Saccharimonadales bacterium]